MSLLSASRYLSAIESESARFREVLADADPAAPVPTCPAWYAARPGAPPRVDAGGSGPGGRQPAQETPRSAPSVERADDVRRLPHRLRRGLGRAGRRTARRRSRRPGLDLVEGTDGRLHPATTGPRGADPPARRRADRDRAHRRARPGPGLRRRRGGARRDVRRAAGVGRVLPAAALHPRRAHRHRPGRVGAAGTVQRDRPVRRHALRRGRHPRRRRPGHRARRGDLGPGRRDGRPAVAPRRRRLDPPGRRPR